MTVSGTSALALLVDTTMQGVSLALVALGDPKAKDQGILWRGEHLENAGSVQAISQLLARGLAAIGGEPDDIAAITVSVGPGSFTGIKVGLAFVHGIRVAVDAPVLALSGLEEAAATLARQRAARDFALFLPATRTHGYVAEIAGGEPRPARLVAFEGGAGPDVVPGAQLASFGDWPLASAFFAGKTLEKLAPSAVCGAGIYGMSLKSQALWPQGFGPAAPEPRYLRLSTAEEKLQKAPT
jgi:tRNA threonylcarbamoyladenosine biosynthesis protein TsaB